MNKPRMVPLTVRVSERAYRSICETARENYISKANTIRLAMNGNLVDYLEHVRFVDRQQGEEIKAALRELVAVVSDIRFELHRIGVNYNQIARLKNIERKYGDSPAGAAARNQILAEGGGLSRSDLDALISRYERAAAKVGELCRIL